MKSHIQRKFHSKRKKVPLNPVEKAVIETLCYRAVFNYPLSYYQLGTFLISKTKITKKDFDFALEELVRRKRITKDKNNKFLLKGIKSINWEENSSNSRKLLEKAESISTFLTKIPWVKLIGVTGAVAAHNASKDDDIDLFIVSQKNRLWLTRGFVFLILVVLGELRKDKDPKRKICPNILVDEKAMQWKKKKRNIYVAHDLVMMHPVFDRDNTYFRFLNKNDWAKQYFSNILLNFPNLQKSKMPKSIVMAWLESLARLLQRGYMKKRKTEEIVKKDFIHFNKSDNTSRVLSSYQKIQRANL